MSTVRIIDQTADSILSAGDYVIVDSQSEGTRKFDLGTSLNGIKEEIGDLSNLDTTVKTDLVSAINEAAQSGGGGGGALTQNTKQALLQCFAHTAWTDDQGQDYYDDLEDALYPFDLLSSITAVYTQSGTVYDTDSLDSLKDDLVVTGNYSDGTYNQTTKYTLSGTLTVGTSTITVTYGGKTATFTVTVTQSAAVLTSITCVYTQSGTVYTTDTLDSLKTDLVVRAIYDNGTSEAVTTYALSGALATGTSTITVTYGGKTATFTVTVTAAPVDTTAVLDTDHDGKGQSNTFGSYSNHTSFCPTVKYAHESTVSSGYEYFYGIIPVDATGSTTCRVWFWDDNDAGITGSAYGSGKPMNVYAESMTEGSFSLMSANVALYPYLTIPIDKNYKDYAYLYVGSTGKVLFAGANTPYYGMDNISEAS